MTCAPSARRATCHEAHALTNRSERGQSRKSRTMIPPTSAVVAPCSGDHSAASPRLAECGSTQYQHQHFAHPRPAKNPRVFTITLSGKNTARPHAADQPTQERARAYWSPQRAGSAIYHHADQQAVDGRCAGPRPMADESAGPATESPAPRPLHPAGGDKTRAAG